METRYWCLSLEQVLRVALYCKKSLSNVLLQNIHLAHGLSHFHSENFIIDPGRREMGLLKGNAD